MKTKSTILLVAMLFALALIFTSCGHQHSWADATCEVAKTCTTCGETEGSPLGHVEEDLAPKAATCSETGLTDGKKCSVCGAVTVAQEEVPTLDHDLEVVEGYAPTCTEPGLTDGKACKNCDYEEAQTEIEPTDHIWNDGVITTPATCMAEGVKTLTCTVSGCGETTTEYIDVDENAHAWNGGVVTTPATCTAEGVKTFTCTRNSEHTKTEAVEIDAEAHSWNDGEITTAPTCTAEGVKTFTCTHDASHTKTEAVAPDAEAHSWNEGEVTTNPTCTAVGVKTFTCTHNGEHKKTEAVAVDENAHSWDNGVVTTDPTCSAEGVKTYTCIHNSDHTKTETVAIDANKHYDNNGDYKCDGCGKNLCSTHENGEPEVQNKIDSTCSAEGSYDSVTYCVHCGTETGRKTVTIEKKPHDEVIDDAVAATCTDGGLTEGKHCGVCNTTITAQQTTDALGHAYGYVWADDNSTCTAICANDASHTETATVSAVALNVTASKVTYTYSVSFANSELAPQQKTVEADVVLENSIATVYAPALSGRVASHDYVKFSFHDASATHSFTIYYSEVDVWDGSVATEFAGGTGTEEDPFIIMTGAQLAYLAKLGMDNTAAKNDVYGTGIYYKLGASLDLSNHQWIPIAMYDTSYQWTYFNGNFDGANHKIVINIDNASLGYGLFSGLGAKSVVKNLILCGSVTVDNRAGALAYITQAGATVENVTNYANVTGTSASAGYIGGLFGATQGAIVNNCVNYGTIAGNYCFNGGIVGQALSNSKITSCTNFGYIAGNGFQSGGIVGSNKPSQIENCVNYGTVTGRQELGGITGLSTAEISGCANYGQIVGSSCTSTGLAQITPSDITKTDCVEGGSVVISEHNLTHTDAKAASCDEDGNVAYDYCSDCKKNYDADGKVIENVVINKTGHSYNDGVTENGVTTYTCSACGDSYTQSSKYSVTVNHLKVDGTVAAAAESLEFAYSEIATINAKTIDNLVPSHDYVKVHVLDNATVTIYYSPVDVWDGETVSTGLQGSGIEEDPFLIQSAADLAYVAQTVNALDGNKVGFAGVYMRLTKSIDLNGADFRIGIYVSGGRKGFGAYLDGNNCSIRGLNNTDSFIGSLESAGYVKNLSIYGVVSKDDAYVGGLCSILYNKAIIENVTSYVTVSGRGAVAGIAGKMYAGTTVRNCVNYGSVNASTWQSGGISGCALGDIDGCINFGTIYTEGTDVGGIAGYSKDGNNGKGTTTNCYNYGNVTSNGEAGKVGGISGWGNIVNNCYNYGTVSAPNATGYVGGVYGYVKTSSEGCVDYSGYGE